MVLPLRLRGQIAPRTCLTTCAGSAGAPCARVSRGFCRVSAMSKEQMNPTISRRRAPFSPSLIQFTIFFSRPPFLPPVYSAHCHFFFLVSGMGFYLGPFLFLVFFPEVASNLFPSLPPPPFVYNAFRSFGSHVCPDPFENYTT